MLATNDVGRRMSDMSGRSSQDTVDSQGENTLGSTEENQIIPPPPAPQRRRVRCLLPMLLAMFVVLVGVVATPVVVFVLDGKGELPFFGKKNETTVAELSLAAITQNATPKASGAAASPMHGPQEGIVALTRPPRPKSSHATPAGSAAGSRYHAAPHHKSDSNRERVYAPTVEGTAGRTTIGATAEVQALSEQVIVVPKGGVMSKLRAAGAADAAAANALRKAHRSKSSHSAVNKSEHRDDNKTTSTTIAGNHTPKTVGAKDNDFAGVTIQHVIASAAANDSGTTKDGLNHLPSVAALGSIRQPLHSISERHNRVARKNAYRRKRGRKSTTMGATSKKRSTTHASSLDSHTDHEGASSKRPRGRNLQISNTLVSFELRRKGSTRSSGSGEAKAHSTQSIHSRSSPPTSSGQSEDALSLLSTRTVVKLGGIASTISSSRRDTHVELANVSANTVRAEPSSENYNFTKAPSYKYSVSLFLAGNSSFEPALRATQTVADSAHYSASPQSTEESKRKDDTHVDGGHERSIVTGGSAGEVRKRSASSRRGIKETERQTSSVGALNEQTTIVPTAVVDKSNAQNRKLPETLKPVTTPERVTSDDWRDSLFVSDTLANKRSLPTANHTTPNDEKKFVDFTNERREDSDVELIGNKSYVKTANDNRELDYSSNEVSEESALSQTQNFASLVTSKMPASSIITLGHTSKSEAHYYTGSSKKKQNLVHNGSEVESGISATDETHKNEITRASPPVIEVRKISPSTAAPAGELLETAVAAPKNGSLGDAMSYTSQKLHERAFEDDNAGLVALEVNFASRMKGTNKTSATTTSALPSSQAILGASRRRPSNDATPQNAGYASHTSPSAMSSEHGIRPLRGDSAVARPADAQANTSTSRAANITLGIRLAGGITGGRGQTTALDSEDGEDDGEEDDEEGDDDESSVTTTSQTKTDLTSSIPRVVLSFTVATAKTRKGSTTKSVAAVTEQRTSQFAGPKSNNVNLTLRSTESTKRIKGNGILRLGVTSETSSPSTLGSATTLKSGQPYESAKNRETTNYSSRMAGIDRNGEKKLANETPIAPTQRPPQNRKPAAPSQSSTMRTSTALTATSRSPKGEERKSSVNVSDDGAIWRRVLPPHNASSSATKTTAQPDSGGVGVENYYDDNKNETSPSGSAEADDSHGEPKTRNRRISGEISVTTKPSKKPDVFQTEYYYDDSPSRKTEESTTQDITEPGYESVPEQEAIDELFS